MRAGRYRISFRISHPSIDPRDITAALAIDPRRSWKAGEPRTTPTGRPLGGPRDKTHWSAELANGEMPAVSLAAAIVALLAKLAAHREFLHRIRTEGGRSEFFIGWFLRSDAGETFPCATLAQMADLGIDLAFDVYCEAGAADQKP